jgi:hypothetical protein
VPREVEHATYEAALREAANPGSLSPDFVASRQVIKQKVGPLERTFADATDAGGIPTRPVVTVIDEILAPVTRRPHEMPAVRVV